VGAIKFSIVAFSPDGPSDDEFRSFGDLDSGGGVSLVLGGELDCESSLGIGDLLVGRPEQMIGVTSTSMAFTFGPQVPHSIKGIELVQKLCESESAETKKLAFCYSDQHVHLEVELTEAGLRLLEEVPAFPMLFAFHFGRRRKGSCQAMSAWREYNNLRLLRVTLAVLTIVREWF